jgi:hypothetical protein
MNPFALKVGVLRTQETRGFIMQVLREVRLGLKYFKPDFELHSHSKCDPLSLADR